MAIIYSWIISSMETAPSEDGLTDVVKFVHWRRAASLLQDDKSYYTDTFGVIGCSTPDPMSFVPYAELTFEQVCGWLEANLDVVELDAGLDIQIANQINPPIVSLPLPWIPQPTIEPIIEQNTETVEPTQIP